MKVIALIVTYNRLDKLQYSLSATLDIEFYRVLVVDNASTDGTHEWLDELSTQTERLEVLHLPYNTGGTGGFSAGLAHLTTQSEWTHVCLFDDDAWPDRGWLKALHQEPEVDGYCSNVTSLNGERCQMNIPFTRLPATLWQTLHYMLCPASFRPAHHRTRALSLSFVGACLSRRCLPALQEALIPELFLYYDDLSAGVALSRQGMFLLWSPALRFWHDTDPQSSLSVLKRYYATRNLLWLSSLPAGPLWSRSATLLRLAQKLLQVAVVPDRKAALGAWISGVADGLKYSRKKDAVPPFPRPVRRR
ncbi:TPA: glycosyltransferase [Enterobacter roggenkampii]|nr:glycosyltransferase [Enterobacter roggenkampii]